MVLPLHLLHPRPGDLEHRHPPAVGPAHEGPHQLAPAHQPQGPQVEVVRLKHPCLLPGGWLHRVACLLEEESRFCLWWGSTKVSPSLLSSRAGVGVSAKITPDVGPPFSLPVRSSKTTWSGNPVKG